MAKRPTIKDVAEASGVSAATVDRVLNGRKSVRAMTAMRVFQAAKQIGYHATPLLQQRVTEDVPQLSFGLILPDIEEEFYQNFQSEAERAAADFSAAVVHLSVEYVSAANPQEVVKALETAGRRNQAIGLVSIDHPRITEQVEKLRQQGVPVYAILTDIAQGVREAYIGTNNIKIGRTAALMLARGIPRATEAQSLQREVAIFVGGHRWHGHELRETGFRAWFRQNRPDITVLEPMVNLDTPDLTFESMLSTFSRYPRLVGIYCAGGGRAGVIRAVREEEKIGQIDVIVNEFSDISRRAMADGIVSMVIDTPVHEVMVTSYRMALEALQTGLGQSKGQHFVSINLFLPESY